MPNFKKFINGGIEDGNLSEFSSIRHKQVRDTKVGSRIERVWATDFERCKTCEDFEKYISKYSKYGSNKYIEQAKARIKSLDAVEKARADRKKAEQIQHIPVSPSTDGSGIFVIHNIIQDFMKVAVWIVIIGGIGIYSYNQYKQEQIISQPTQHKDLQEENISQIRVENNFEQENSVTEPEPQEIWWNCTICGTTGRCQLCMGTGRCGVCGGGGILYRSSEWIACNNCGGSGRCPSCEGSGLCFACHGSGKCKLEE